MIKLKSITGKDFHLNSDLIYRIDVEFDTIITLVGGKTIRVKDTADEVAQKVIHYKQQIMSPIERKDEV